MPSSTSLLLGSYSCHRTLRDPTVMHGKRLNMTTGLLSADYLFVMTYRRVCRLCSSWICDFLHADTQSGAEGCVSFASACKYLGPCLDTGYMQLSTSQCKCCLVCDDLCSSIVCDPCLQPRHHCQ